MLIYRKTDLKYRLGDVVPTHYGLCEIIGIKSYEKVKVRFIETGYISIAKMWDLKKGAVKDMLKPSVCKVGYLGKDFKNIRKNNKELFKKAYQVWIDMIKRCYDKNRPGYKSYGYKGVTVSDRWLNFSNFYKDIQNIEGYNVDDFLESKIFLDKDKLQLNKPYSERVYSKDTCVFLSRDENNKLQNYESQLTKFEVIFPDGHHEIHKGIRKFGADNNINYTNICACLNGKQKTYKNMKFIKIS